MDISKKKAREFLTHYHGLNGAPKYKGEKGVLEYIKKVGCIQYDPLNVVGRNPDLVLQSRVEEYTPDILEKLLYKDRVLIDGWDKMMSIYSTGDWPYFSRIRLAKDRDVRNSLNYRNSSHAVNFTNDVRSILLKRGPLLSTKIDLGSGGTGSWGHRKIAGATMDYMFCIGELGIHSKKNTQKIYDLVENLLPEQLLNSSDPFKSDRDFYKWYIKRRIGGVGLLWDSSGGGWLGHFISNRKLRLSVLSELMEEGILESLSIEDIDKKFYIRRDDIHIFEQLKSSHSQGIKFLAPLDNLLWDRDMIEAIFGFKYRWEVYTPVAKREYGYYVLPVLYGDKLIGRFEPAQQRGSDPLVVKNWWWEDGISIDMDLKNEIKQALNKFGTHLSADGVIHDKIY